MVAEKNSKKRASNLGEAQVCFNAQHLNSAVDEYMNNILLSQNVERKIDYLINLASLCFDYNQAIYASKVYKKVMDVCMENETGTYPRFKEKALIAARSIQSFIATFLGTENQKNYEDRVINFYNERFPN